MELSTVIEKLTAKRGGQFTTIVLDRIERFGGKKEGRDVRVISRYQVLAHAIYANCATVREAVEQGDRQPPQLPNWAEAREIGGVRFWIHKTSGEIYLPVPTIGTNRRKNFYDPVTGTEIDKAELNIKPKPAPKEGQAPFTACNIVNIASIA
jgi:hypothetical protein